MQPTKLSDQDFKRLTQTVYEKTGVTLDETKRSMMSSRIRRRLRALDLDCFSSYISRISRGELPPEEVQAFIDAVTTHKTSFFRTPSVWECLRREFEDRAAKGQGAEVWSAACSTGQEPYSLAMMLSAILGPSPMANRWHVTASDVSPLTVETAQAGIFDEGSVQRAAELQPAIGVSKHFEQTGEGLKVTDGLARGIRFQVHNLMDPSAESYDTVLLRNVIIYFSEEDVTRVINHVTSALRPGGLLVIGESESLLGRDVDLEYEAPCVYRKKI